MQTHEFIGKLIFLKKATDYSVNYLSVKEIYILYNRQTQMFLPVSFHYEHFIKNKQNGNPK